MCSQWAGAAGVGMVVRGLADRDRQEDHVAPGLGLGHAPVARSAVGVAPAAARVAVEKDSAARVERALRPHDRRFGKGEGHGPMGPRSGGWWAILDSNQ